jgi:hypothetical protein
MTYDRWKTTNPADECLLGTQPQKGDDMDELAKELESALKNDFPNAKNLSFKAPPATGKPVPTTSEQINATIAELAALIRVLEQVRARL